MGKVNPPLQFSGLASSFKETSKKLVVDISSKNSALNLSGALLFIGLGCSLKWWYNDQLLTILLKNNLPALSEPQQKISRETGEYVLAEQTNQFRKKKDYTCYAISPRRGANSHNNNGEMAHANNVQFFDNLIERIDLYANSVVIKLKSPWEKHAYQRFVGVFPERGNQHIHFKNPINLGGTAANFSVIDDVHKYIKKNGKPLGSSFTREKNNVQDLVLERIQEVSFSKDKEENINEVNRIIGAGLMNGIEVNPTVSNCLPRTPTQREDPVLRKIDIDSKENSADLTEYWKPVSLQYPEGLMYPKVVLTQSIDTKKQIPLAERTDKVDGANGVNFISNNQQKLTATVDRQKYTSWGPIYPESWFKLSARGLCVDQPDTLANFFFQQVVDFSGTKSGYFSLPFLRKVNRFTPNFKTHHHVNEVDVPKDYYFLAATRSSVINNEIDVVSKSVSGTSEGGSFKRRKLSYPLELTTTMVGWQPPINTLILNSYLDEIPYKLETYLPLLSDGKRNQLQDDHQAAQAVNHNSHTNLITMSTEVREGTLKNTGELTKRKMSEALEIKRVLKNELSHLVHSLAINLVDKPISAKYLSTSPKPPESNSLAKTMNYKNCDRETLMKVSVPTDIELGSSTKELSELMYCSSSLTPKDRGTVGQSGQNEPNLLLCECNSHCIDTDTPLLRRKPSKSIGEEIGEIHLKPIDRVDPTPKGMLSARQIAKGYSNFVDKEADTINYKVDRPLNRKKTESSGIDGIDANPIDSAAKPNNTYVINVNPAIGVLPRTFVGIDKETDYKEAQQVGKVDRASKEVFREDLENSKRYLDPLSLLGNLNITFNNLSKLTAPSILLPINTDAFSLSTDMLSTESASPPTVECECPHGADQSTESLALIAKTKKPTATTRKTTLAYIDHINTVDKNISFSDTRSRLMSGYVYPDKRSNCLEPNLYRWLSSHLLQRKIHINLLTKSTLADFYCSPSLPQSSAKPHSKWPQHTPEDSAPHSMQLSKLVESTEIFGKKRPGGLWHENSHRINNPITTVEDMYLNMFQKMSRVFDQASLIDLHIPITSTTSHQQSRLRGSSSLPTILPAPLLTWSAPNGVLETKKLQTKSIEFHHLGHTENRYPEIFVNCGNLERGMEQQNLEDGFSTKVKEQNKSKEAQQITSPGSPRIAPKIDSNTHQYSRKLHYRFAHFPGFTEPNQFFQRLAQENTASFPLKTDRWDAADGISSFAIPRTLRGRVDTNSVDKRADTINDRRVDKQSTFNHPVPLQTPVDIVHSLVTQKKFNNFIDCNARKTAYQGIVVPREQFTKDFQLQSNSIGGRDNPIDCSASVNSIDYVNKTSAIDSVDPPGNPTPNYVRSAKGMSTSLTLAELELEVPGGYNKTSNEQSSLEQSSSWATHFLGPENPLTDRQSHFFGQRRLDTMTTGGYQRDYLRYLAKEALAQSTPKGFTEKSASVERLKILSFSKSLSSFPLKRRKYAYLLEKSDQWHLLFQEQFHAALEDPKKYPPLTPEERSSLSKSMTSDHGSGRIKVAAPLVTARFPAKRSLEQCLTSIDKWSPLICVSNRRSIDSVLESSLHETLTPNFVQGGLTFQGKEVDPPGNPTPNYVRSAKGMSTSLTKGYSKDKVSNSFPADLQSSLYALRDTGGSAKLIPSVSDVKAAKAGGSSKDSTREVNRSNFRNFPVDSPWKRFREHEEKLTRTSILCHYPLPTETMLAELNGSLWFNGGTTSIPVISSGGGRSLSTQFSTVPGGYSKEKSAGLTDNCQDRHITSCTLYEVRGTEGAHNDAWNKLTLLLNVATQEPLTSHSWDIIIQWSFLVALLFWVEQMLLEGVFPALSALEQLLLGAIDIKSSDRTRVIRVIKGDVNTPKFQDIAGVDGLLGELSELVLFLRGHREQLWNRQNSHGVLLTGPPGAGKTFLVRALAGEAKVPVLILSAGALAASKVNSNKPSWSIRHAFRRARQLAPCILFIDELDALGRSRGEVVTDINEIVAHISNHNQNRAPANQRDPINHPNSYATLENREMEGRGETRENNLRPTKNQGTRSKFGPLTQLLVSMDGVNNLSGVLVLGATNRPESLDPALTRPGRFERVIRVEKPAEEKRVEILKLYSRKLGVQHKIPWSYLANRTVGLTAADLAVAMNYSSLKAILQGSMHTVETIEYGLDSIARFDNKNTPSPLTESTLASLQSMVAVPLTAFTLPRRVNAVRGRAEQMAKSQIVSTQYAKPEGDSVPLPLTEKANSTAMCWNVNLCGSGTLKGSALCSAELNISKEGEAHPEPCSQLGVPGGYSKDKVAPYHLTQKSVVNPPLLRFSEAELECGESLPLTSYRVGAAEDPSGYPEGHQVDINSKRLKNRLIERLSQIAYYQAGKVVIQTLLPLHPPVALVRMDLSGITAATSADTYIPIDNPSAAHWRSSLESRIVGLYGGKAASLLILSNFISGKKHRKVSLDNSGITFSLSSLDLSLMSTKSSPTPKFSEASLQVASAHPGKPAQQVASITKKLVNKSLSILRKTQLTFPISGSRSRTNYRSLRTIHSKTHKLPPISSAQSDIGIRELQVATRLADRMVNEWGFYSWGKQHFDSESTPNLGLRLQSHQGEKSSWSKSKLLIDGHVNVCAINECAIDSIDYVNNTYRKDSKSKGFIDSGANPLPLPAVPLGAREPQEGVPDRVGLFSNFALFEKIVNGVNGKKHFSRSLSATMSTSMQSKRLIAQTTIIKNVSQLLHLLHLSTAQRNRLYPSWFRLYLPDMEATELMKNAADYYFNTTLKSQDLLNLVVNNRSILLQSPSGYQINGLSRRIAGCDTNDTLKLSSDFIAFTGAANGISRSPADGKSQRGPINRNFYPSSNELENTESCGSVLCSAELNWSKKGAFQGPPNCVQGGLKNYPSCGSLYAVRGKEVSQRQTFSIDCNDLSTIEKEFFYHGLVTNSFTKALLLADTNRQLLDYFADYLLRFQIIRQDRILYLFSTLLLDRNKEVS